MVSKFYQSCPWALGAVLATALGPAAVQAQNTNTTIQDGRVNINRTYQAGDSNDNATYQTGKVNINRTIQIEGYPRSQTTPFSQINDPGMNPGRGLERRHAERGNSGQHRRAER